MKRNEIADVLKAAKRIVLCTHVNPDGDAIGASLAMAAGLRSLGKDVTVTCADPVPQNLFFLAGVAQVVKPSTVACQHFDLFLSLDCADEGRLGEGACLRKAADKTLQIDHHRTNPGYMELNYVDGDAPATCLLVKRVLDAMEVSITGEMAACLYTGLATDTGNFAFASTTPEAFRMVADLMETAGLPLAELNRRLFRQQPKPVLKLTERVIHSMTYHHCGELTITTLSRADLAACEAKDEHTDNLVNLGLNQPGVRMSIQIREAANGGVKASLRAVEPDRVDKLAAHFGGGGHAQAAGCSLPDSLAEAKTKLLEAAIRILDGENL